MERIFAKRTWQIKPGYLRLQRWVQDFNPYMVSSSVAQVWIQISELHLEYWNPNIITTLALAVGTVIKLDDHTTSRSMGRFARVLVELDLKHDREEYVMFERAGHRSVVYIQYERLPEFCNYCSIIGHATGNCSTSYNSKQAGKSKSVHPEPKVASKPNQPAGVDPISATKPRQDSAVAGGAPEGVVSIQGLEVHLPPIEEPLGTGVSPLNSMDGQIQAFSQTLVNPTDVQATSSEDFEQVPGQRGRRGRPLLQLFPKIIISATVLRVLTRPKGDLIFLQGQGS
ncbi:hypothetical protein ACS0TY_012093 [Phlomoides rotata]